MLSPSGATTNCAGLLGIAQIGKNMTALRRVRVGLTGFAGSPGVNTFYFLDTSTALASLNTLYQGLQGVFPSVVTIQIENTGDIIESTTGELLGSWSGNAVAPFGGTGAGSYSAPSGAMIGWETGAVRDGRRLRGRTFLVPAVGSQYDQYGTLNDTMVTSVQASATAFIFEQSSSFVIWHRPFAGAPAVGTKPARPATLGGHALVIAARVPDKAVVLRSRRD